MRQNTIKFVFFFHYFENDIIFNGFLVNPNFCPQGKNLQLLISHYSFFLFFDAEEGTDDETDSDTDVEE